MIIHQVPPFGMVWVLVVPVPPGVPPPVPLAIFPPDTPDIPETPDPQTPDDSPNNESLTREPPSSDPFSISACQTTPKSPSCIKMVPYVSQESSYTG